MIRRGALAVVAGISFCQLEGCGGTGSARIPVYAEPPAAAIPVERAGDNLAAVTVSETVNDAAGKPSAPVPSSQAASATSGIKVLDGDLADYVQHDLIYAGRHSERYLVPDPLELRQFSDLVLALLARDLERARVNAARLDMELMQVRDSGGSSSSLYCLRETVARGRGFFCINYEAARPVHVSVPHPLHDQNTHRQGVVVARGTGARYLSISTTHRCASRALSGCSGTTRACGTKGPYRVSDMAHSTNSFFQRFAELVSDQDNESINVQLHGCGSSSCPARMGPGDIVARVSAGTTADLSADDLVNRIAAHMQSTVTRLLSGAAVKSCSRSGETDRALCGTTNTQGRYINGETENACTRAPGRFMASRFLHVEQNSDLRHDNGDGDLITPWIVIDAINSEIAARP